LKLDEFAIDHMPGSSVAKPTAGSGGKFHDLRLLPGLRSVYRWQGAIQRADEVLLLVKTTRERVEPLTARVASLHPYELPEVVAVEVAGGLAAYLDWVEEQTRTGD